jgi:hypothetical protein
MSEFIPPQRELINVTALTSPMTKRKRQTLENNIEIIEIEDFSFSSSSSSSSSSEELSFHKKSRVETVKFEKRTHLFTTAAQQMAGRCEEKDVLTVCPLCGTSLQDLTANVCAISSHHIQKRDMKQ